MYRYYKTIHTGFIVQFVTHIQNNAAICLVKPAAAIATQTYID